MSADEIGDSNERECHGTPERKAGRMHTIDPEGGPECRLSQRLIVFFNTLAVAVALLLLCLAFLLSVFCGQFTCVGKTGERVPSIDALRTPLDPLFNVKESRIATLYVSSLIEVFVRILARLIFCGYIPRPPPPITISFA
jgi:hypothetical protein